MTGRPDDRKGMTEVSGKGERSGEGTAGEMMAAEQNDTGELVCGRRFNARRQKRRKMVIAMDNTKSGSSAHAGGGRQI